MVDHVRRFQLIVAVCAAVTLSIAAWLTRIPVAESDRSTLVLFLSVFALATAVVATAGRVSARLAGWACGLAAVVAYVGYLAGQWWTPWTYVVAAALAVATTVALAIGGRVR